MIPEPDHRGPRQPITPQEAQSNINSFLLTLSDILDAPEVGFIPEIQGQRLALATPAFMFTGETDIGSRLNNQDRIGLFRIDLLDGTQETLALVADGNDQLDEMANGGTAAARLVIEVMHYAYQEYRLSNLSRGESLVRARMDARTAIMNHPKSQNIQGKIDACVSAMALGDDGSYGAIGLGDTATIQIAGDATGPIHPLHNYAYIAAGVDNLPDNRDWRQIKHKIKNRKKGESGVANLSREEQNRVINHFSNPADRMMLLAKARELDERNVITNAVVWPEAAMPPADVQEGQLPPGASVVICSDGLWEAVHPDMIGDLLQRPRVYAEALNSMIRSNNHWGITPIQPDASPVHILLTAALVEEAQSQGKMKDNIALVVIQPNKAPETSTASLRRVS